MYSDRQKGAWCIAKYIQIMKREVATGLRMAAVSLYLGNITMVTFDIA